MELHEIEEYLRRIAQDVGDSTPGDDTPPPPACSRCHVTGRILNEKGICETCARTLERGYEISQLAGRCANGAERDHGVLFHARLLREDGYPEGKALCGAKPGKRSIGWSYHPGDEVTCERCLARLGRMKETR